MSGKTAQIKELEQRIADLKARLPKHSVPPAMLIELEELEEALERARAEAAESRSRLDAVGWPTPSHGTPRGAQEDQR